MRRLLAAAGVVATITVAGCGQAATPSIGNIRLSAAEAIQQSAQKAEDVTSYAADVVVDLSDSESGGSHVQGTLRHQQKPQITSDITLDKVTHAGQELPGGFRMILQNDSAYVKVDLLKTALGATKPWMRFDLKALGKSTGADLNQVLSQAQQIDLKTSAALLTASKDVKTVGTEQIGGVDTTHYSGTFPVVEAVKQLPSEIQAELGDQWQSRLSGVQDMTFNSWIDAQGLPRKVELGGATGTVTYKATMLFRSFNEPVTIEAPPADQVGEMPEKLTQGG